LSAAFFAAGSCRATFDDDGRTGFSDLFVAQQGHAYGFIDASGVMAIPARYLHAKPFFEGLAAVKVRPEQGCGFINERGRMAVELAYDHVGDFHEGFAAVMIDTYWDYIDRSGLIAIQPQFDAAGDFSRTLAEFEINGIWGWIDRKGKAVWPPDLRQ
jgi:hypothetical protein